jgi:hypothetical protein
MRRATRVAGTVVLGAASLAAALVLTRKQAGRREYVDVYRPDGSKQTLDEGSPEFGRLMPLARDVLAAAR